jgi:hypothetical protein
MRDSTEFHQHVEALYAATIARSEIVCFTPAMVQSEADKPCEVVLLCHHAIPRYQNRLCLRGLGGCCGAGTWKLVNDACQEGCSGQTLGSDMMTTQCQP